MAALLLVVSSADGIASTITVQDNYWGGIGNPSGPPNAGSTAAYEADVIGDPSAFNIMAASVSRSGGNLTITINTNYNAADFNLTQFGDLFLTPASNWNPNGTAATHWQTDDLMTTGTIWKYAVQASGLNGDAIANKGVIVPPTVSGAATVYALGANNASIITSYVTASGCSQPYGYPYVSGCNYIWRYDQPVQVATATATLLNAANGGWAFSQDPTAGYDLSYTIDAAALDPSFLVGSDGFDIAFSWAMTCANDIVQGIAYEAPSTVPEPTSLGLFVSSLAVFGFMRRTRRRINPSEPG